MERLFSIYFLMPCFSARLNLICLWKIHFFFPFPCLSSSWPPLGIFPRPRDRPALPTWRERPLLSTVLNSAAPRQAVLSRLWANPGRTVKMNNLLNRNCLLTALSLFTPQLLNTLAERWVSLGRLAASSHAAGLPSPHSLCQVRQGQSAVVPWWLHQFPLDWLCRCPALFKKGHLCQAEGSPLE
jgi:hypothetical protein